MLRQNNSIVESNNVSPSKSPVCIRLHLQLSTIEGLTLCTPFAYDVDLVIHNLGVVFRRPQRWIEEISYVRLWTRPLRFTEKANIRLQKLCLA